MEGKRNSRQRGRQRVRRVHGQAIGPARPERGSVPGTGVAEDGGNDDVALLKELAEADRPIVVHPPLLHGDERVRDYPAS
jgi:hypothetical protein